ncbi:hypothetical protein DFP94_101184 [Fontibacillus phaseoli]|uniref:Uncharacterized protein n=1 Tax=Fontibacillus phaseoli TaxID=1416533 RepID=A0A369BSM4_9BACL|nr:hypothetical protein [Fontibacillus phaseoli]RCX22604.1 hypothetical protein DFP94_101184 [Fontibacillus phaseoli]
MKEVYYLVVPEGVNPVKPYAVLSLEGDSGSNPWKGLRYLFQIRLYVSKINAPTSELDFLTTSIANSLDKQLLGDEATSSRVAFYQGQVGTDIVDDERDTIQRNLQLSVLSPKPLAELTPITSDPWLTALAAWTRQALEADWSVYGGNWPPEPKTPSILWRITEMDATPRGSSAYELQKKATAFIQAKDSNQEHVALLQLVEGLAAAVKIPIGAGDRKFVRVITPQVNTRTNASADGYAATGEGPLTVTLSRRVTSLADEAAPPLMQFVHYESHI